MHIIVSIIVIHMTYDTYLQQRRGSAAEVLKEQKHLLLALHLCMCMCVYVCLYVCMCV
jgi:hypothetical protein